MNKIKKGSLEIDMMGKIILVVIFILIFVLITYLFKDKIVSLVSEAGKILRFR